MYRSASRRVEVHTEGAASRAMLCAVPHRGSLIDPLIVLFAVVAACRPPTAVVVAPKPRDNAMPTPEQVSETQAAKDGKRGAVRVAYCVDTDGKPQELRVIEPLEPEFDALALRTVAGWRFEPATRDGVAFEQCTDIRVELRP